jgi:VWFA-related protein
MNVIIGTMNRVLAVVVLVAAFYQAGSAQQPAQPAERPQQQQPPPAENPQQTAAPGQPTFRTGINFVRVDVIVSDKKGAPVADLTLNDFEVLEDGKPQKIEQFRLVKVTGNPEPGEAPARQIRSRYDEESEASRDDVRLFVIFFDDYHTRVGSALAVKEPLTRFVQTQLGPNDLVAIMYPLTPLDAISVTRNHNSIITAIKNFEGRKFRYDPRNDFEAQYANYPTEVVERIRNEVVMTALRGLATRLGSLREGRKAIIFVSEGFTTMLPPQMRNPIATLPGLGNPNSRDPFAGEGSAREETAMAFSTADLMSQLRDVWDAANRNNAAIYSLDPRGLAGSEFGIEENISLRTDSKYLQASQDSLRTLSGETDGRAIVNQNDLAKGLAQIVRDSSAYYLIGYNSSQAPDDGKFHEINVKVKRSGVDVRARKGYWAPTKEDTARAVAGPKPEAPKAVQQALASIATPGGRSGAGSRYVNTWIGTSRAEDGKTRVTFVWEPAPPTPGVQRDAPGRVSLMAAGPGGDLVFRGRVPDAATASAVPSTGGAPGAATGPQRVVFDAPPGKMELRISVEDARGGDVLDNEIRDVTIPDLTSPDPALSTPRVFRARTARDFQMAARDAEAVPVAGREFLRTDRLLIRFDVYGADAPTARLLNRNGNKMADVPVTATTVGGTHQIDLGLGAFPPGEYLVEISVGSVKELIPMKVGS